MGGRDRQVREFKLDAADRTAPGASRADQILAHHHFGERPRGLLRRPAVGNDFSHAHYGSRMAERPDLFQLVRDVKDRDSFAGQPPQRAEQFRRLLRREDRRGLVHDQQSGMLEQAPHDLDPLPFSDGQGVDVTVGIERQAVLRGDAANAPGKIAGGEFRRNPERDVLLDRHRFEQGKMLEHHADAASARRRRAGDPDVFALPEHPPGVGFLDAVDEFHQRRFARAVFAQQGVNFPGHDPETDILVGDDSGIGLRYPDQLETRRLRHVKRAARRLPTRAGRPRPWPAHPAWARLRLPRRGRRRPGWRATPRWRASAEVRPPPWI